MQKKKFLVRLGNHIVHLRKMRGLSQRDLAFACGKDPQSIERIENGKSNPTAYYLYEISLALEVHPNELINFDLD